MTRPALLMRNTTDDPTWTSLIYHDHVSWFPGAGYVVRSCFANTSPEAPGLHVRHVPGHPQPGELLRRRLEDETRGLEAGHRRRHRHGHGRRQADRHQGRELRRQRRIPCSRAGSTGWRAPASATVKVVTRDCRPRRGELARRARKASPRGSHEAVHARHGIRSAPVHRRRDRDPGELAEVPMAAQALSMVRRAPLVAAAGVLAFVAPSSVRAAPGAGTDARPNIIVILVDDMGRADIGPFGGEIPTPNLDALAARGVRFTQFYSTPRCSPSRASLLTGLYPHQAGMGHLDTLIRPGSIGTTGRLSDRAVTIPKCCARPGTSRPCRVSGISGRAMAHHHGNAGSIAR